MSDVAEGLGGAIEGALTGRAVEPSRGEATSTEADNEACSNCGAIVSGAYCSQCGQKRHVHRSLSAIGHDLIHGVLHLDGKLWDTLPLLTFKPGQLTRRYIDGERAKFVSPMAMFLFTVFAMFAVFQMVGLSVPSNLGDNVGTEAAREDIQAKRDELQLELDSLPADAPASEREELESELNAAKGALSAMQGVGGFVQGFTDGASKDDDASFDVNVTGVETLDKGLVKKWRENPGLMLYKLQANAYKFSWLLIPLSIPFVWLTFAWRRRFKAYDHAVFVTYSLSFMSMLFIAASLFSLSSAVDWVGALLMVLVPPIHIYKQLRGTYEIGRFGAFWRLLVISLFIWIVIALFLQVLILLGAF